MEAFPIVFFKSYKQRLTELKEVLSDKSKSPIFSSSSKIKYIWSTYLDIYIEPVGWQALWKMSRELCLDLKLKFPTNVVVMVESVDVKELTANVTITNVENKIEVPDKFEEVPLIELFPLDEQDSINVIIVEKTAEAIDHLRLFYGHLFYPWEEEDDDTNWVADHLENRLRLYYDKISSKIYHETADELTNLIKKGKKIYQEVKKLEEIVIDKEDNPDPGPITLKLFELHHELEHVKNQLTIFDNATLRELKMKENRTKLINLRQNLHGNQHFALVVMLRGTSDELIEYLAEIKKIVKPDTFLRPVHSLQQAMNLLIPNETILIGPGVHCLQNSQALQEYGTGIRGIMEADKCIVSETEDGWALFDLCGKETKLDNLTIQSNQIQYLVVLRQGAYYLNNIVLQGFHTAVGIIVHSGASLHASQCKFVSCTIGLVASPESTINLTECIFSKNKVALEVQENASVTINSCTIVDSEEYAVQLNQSEISRKEGSLELLSVSDSICTTDLKLIHNSRDVLVEYIEPLQLDDLNKNTEHL